MFCFLRRRNPHRGGSDLGWRGKDFRSDINSRCLEGARRNAEAAGVGKHVSSRIADARGLEEFYDSSVDRMVTNPPYGVRMGREKNLRETYFSFLNSASKKGRRQNRVDKP